MLAKPNSLVALALYHNDFGKANQIIEVCKSVYLSSISITMNGCALVSLQLENGGTKVGNSDLEIFAGVRGKSKW